MGTIRSNYKKTIISIGLIVILLISTVIIYPDNYKNKCIVEAASTWKQETQMDFENGTLEDIEIYKMVRLN